MVHGMYCLSTHCQLNLPEPLASNTTLTTYQALSDSSKNTLKMVIYLYRLLEKMRYSTLLKLIRHPFIPEILVCLSFSLECVSTDIMGLASHHSNLSSDVFSPEKSSLTSPFPQIRLYPITQHIIIFL